MVLLEQRFAVKEMFVYEISLFPAMRDNRFNQGIEEPLKDSSPLLLNTLRFWNLVSLEP